MHCYRGLLFVIFLSKFLHKNKILILAKANLRQKKITPDSGSLGVQRCKKRQNFDVLTIYGHLKRTSLPKNRIPISP